MNRHDDEHIHIHVNLNGLEDRLDRIHLDLHAIREIVETTTTGEEVMAAIEELRGVQAATRQAITDLGTTIETEAAQVQQLLADLVAAQGNDVTDADVAEANDALARLQAAGAAVSGLVPDAPNP